ncbi:MAG: ABC transporter permease [Bacteroidales bacterium]
MPSKRRVLFEKILVRHILKGSGPQMARPSVRIAIASVAIGVAVMISSIAILQGFKHEIRSRIAGFAAHIRVSTFSDNTSAEPSPFTADSLLIDNIYKVHGVKHVQKVAYKTSLLRTRDQIQGLVLKGGGSDFDTSFLKENLTTGRLPNFSDTANSYELLISKKIAQLLQVKTGDKVTLFFMGQGENTPRARRFAITGIYDTGLEDFDQTMAFCNIRHLRRINDWKPDEVGLLEIYLDREDRMDEISQKLYQLLPSQLNVSSMRENYPQIFDWLQLQDVNVVVILVLMILVSVMAMSSALVILIVEKTRSIGILKALGAHDSHLRRAFLLASTNIAGKGLLWGNLVGLVLMGLQAHFHLVPLPRDSYYMDYVPVLIQVTPLVLINVGTLVLCVVSMLLPTRIITRITPLKAIRFR